MTSIPTREPRSSTTSPSCRSATAVGLPQPSEASVAASGSSPRWSASYSASPNAGPPAASSQHEPPPQPAAPSGGGAPGGAPRAGPPAAAGGPFGDRAGRLGVAAPDLVTKLVRSGCHQQ